MGSWIEGLGFNILGAVLQRKGRLKESASGALRPKLLNPEIAGSEGSRLRVRRKFSRLAVTSLGDKVGTFFAALNLMSDATSSLDSQYWVP